MKNSTLCSIANIQIVPGIIKRCRHYFTNNFNINPGDIQILVMTDITLGNEQMWPENIIAFSHIFQHIPPDCPYPHGYPWAVGTTHTPSPYSLSIASTIQYAKQNTREGKEGFPG